MYLDGVILENRKPTPDFWIALVGLGILLALWSRVVLTIPLEEGYLDWYSINLQLDVVRQAIATNQVPEKIISLGLFDYSNYFGETFWTFPYLIRTPDLVLLSVLSNKVYVLLHLLIFISIGYIGLFKLLKKYIPSSMVCAVAGITYLYSGIFIGRIVAGHLQLVGYFLVPTFILIVINALEHDQPCSRNKNWMKASLLLTLVAYLGSIQTLFQMLLFLIGLLVFKKSRLFAIKTFLSTFLLISPIIFASSLSTSYKIGGVSRTVFEGFGWRFLNHNTFKGSYSELEQSLSIHSILAFLPKHFAEIVVHLFVASTNSSIAIIRGGWEWDIYVIPIGLLAFFVPLMSRKARVKIKQLSNPSLRPLVGVLIFFLMLSLSLVYRIMFGFLQSILNINAVDRLPVRSMIYPITFLFLICFILLNFLIQSRRQEIRILGHSLILMNLVLVVLHSENWLKATKKPISQMITLNSAFIEESAPFELTVSPFISSPPLIFGICLSIVWIVILFLKIFNYLPLGFTKLNLCGKIHVRYFQRTSNSDS